MKKQIVIIAISSALILLFAYTASSKLLDPKEFASSMTEQPLPSWMTILLIKALPWTEIAVGLALIFPITRLYGLWASTVLMVAFTGYIGLGVAHVFPRVPCSCGGVFRHMSWPNHFYFNLGVLTAAIMALLLERGSQKMVSSQTPTLLEHQ